MFSDFKSDRTLASKRAQFREEIISNTINEAFQKILNDSTERDWQGAFWAMGLLRYHSELTDSAVTRALESYNRRSEEFKRALLEVVYGLYPKIFAEQLEQIAAKTTNEKLFAICALHTCQIDSEKTGLFLSLMEKKFPHFSDHPILIMLENDLKPDKKISHPAMVDLLIHNFPGNRPIVYSFQRPDRRYPGLAIMRQSNGRFYRDTESGSIVYTRQLALSNSNLPGYITNGNTPQGIYSIQGLSISDNIFIGPVPTIQLVMPIEAGPSVFFHTEQELGEWQMDMYSELLPESWRNYLPIYETYYAGKAGRSEIIAHGSTINPEYYKNEPFYPLTPSLGCLTTYEKWNPDDGLCLFSGQLILSEILKKTGAEKGFYIVVETKPKSSMLNFAEIKPMILKAEARLIDHYKGNSHED